MINLTPTQCAVNDQWIRETRSLAERHHMLGGVDPNPERRPSVMMRLAHLLTRPVRMLVPQHV